MASAGASGTVTVEDQRSYIRIETLRGKNPTEIHSALREICGKQTVDSSTVSRWATCFREGHFTINDDHRPGMCVCMYVIQSIFIFHHTHLFITIKSTFKVINRCV
jgi:hypothetical protein